MSKGKFMGGNGEHAAVGNRVAGSGPPMAGGSAANEESMVNQALDFLATITNARPKIAVILGSGLAGITKDIQLEAAIPYSLIPGFGCSSAPGHAGQLLFGKLGGQDLVVMQGRLHLYEGHSAAQVVLPLRVAKALGASSLLVTNAAGSINTNFNVGEIMLITDQINFTAHSPLVFSAGGQTREFTDMTHAYDRNLRALALKLASEHNIKLRSGVYLGLRGPSFETPAEIRAFRTWGADAVGMSTVLEVIAARALEMRVLGLSLLTNMAAGVLDQPLSGSEVLEVSAKAMVQIQDLVHELLACWPYGED